MKHGHNFMFSGHFGTSTYNVYEYLEDQNSVMSLRTCLIIVYCRSVITWHKHIIVFVWWTCLQVIRKLVNLIATWYILEDLSTIFHDHRLVKRFLSSLFFFWVADTVYCLIHSFIVTRPTFVLASMTSPSAHHSRLDDVCPVCLDVMSDSASCACTPCDHVFHRTCLSLSLHVALKCPTCRRRFVWRRYDVTMTSTNGLILSDVKFWSQYRLSRSWSCELRS